MIHAKWLNPRHRTFSSADQKLQTIEQEFRRTEPQTIAYLTQ